MGRFVMLISAGAILACIVAFIWGLISPYVPAEYMWPVIWGLIIGIGVFIAILLNR
jgi:hypothetical protein